MANADMNFTDTAFNHERLDPARGHNAGSARSLLGRTFVGFIERGDLVPSDAALPSCAEGFEEGFLDGEPAGQLEIGMTVGKGLGLFLGCEDPIQKSPVPFLNGISDALALYQVYPDSNDHGGGEVCGLISVDLCQEILHFPNGSLKTDQDGPGDDAMPDIVFNDLRNGEQSFNIPIVKAVAGIDAHA